MWKKFKNLIQNKQENELCLQEELEIHPKTYRSFSHLFLFEYVNLNKVDDLLFIQKEAYGEIPWQKEALLRDIKHNPSSFYVLAYDELGNPAAFISCWMRGQEAHLTNLCVRPSYQRQGLGRKLLEQIYRSALSQGMAILTLEVRISNRAAISLYQSLGFEAVRVKKNYYISDGEDALDMLLPLDKKRWLADEFV